MLIKTQGIVFRCIKYGETSLIVDIYTQAIGLRSYIINGARKAKSRMPAGLFQIGSILDLVVYEKEHKSLNRIKEARPSTLYQAIPFQIKKSAIVQFIIEITRKSIREKEKNNRLFEFLDRQLIELDQTLADLRFWPILYSLNLPNYLGFDLVPTTLEPPYYLDIREGIFVQKYDDVTYQLNDLLSLWINQILQGQEPLIKSQQRKHLLDGILLYYKYHIEGFGEVNSHRILEEVFH